MSDVEILMIPYGAYVAESARLRKTSRCEALARIVARQMCILVDKQVEQLEEGGWSA